MYCYVKRSTSFSANHTWYIRLWNLKECYKKRTHQVSKRDEKHRNLYSFMQMQQLTLDEKVSLFAYMCCFFLLLLLLFLFSFWQANILCYISKAQMRVHRIKKKFWATTKKRIVTNPFKSQPTKKHLILVREMLLCASFLFLFYAFGFHIFVNGKPWQRQKRKRMCSFSFRVHSLL